MRMKWVRAYQRRKKIKHGVRVAGRMARDKWVNGPDGPLHVKASVVCKRRQADSP